MRSSDLARLAGVTVRTLRHYHQIGLLAEPARDANGYRRYGVRHLIRLLRIGHLRALGLTLAELPPLLDGHNEQRSDVLDRLDASLTQQIERLREQRRIVAALRNSVAPLDMPADITKHLLPLEAGRSVEVIRSGREQLLLLARMIAPEGRATIAGLYDRLADPDLAAVVRDLGQRFDRLGHDTTQTEMTDLADAYVAQLGPWMREYDDAMGKFITGDTAVLLSAHAIDALNVQQRRFLAELSVRLANDDDRSNNERSGG